MSPGGAFRFRLERVRALRERSEELAKRELALSLGRLRASEDRLRAADAQLAKAHAGQRSAAASALSGADMLANQAFAERAEQQRTLDVQATKRSRNEVADRGVRLSHAAQDHEMLKRLKERQRAAHVRELARRESQMLDELAIDGFRRRAA
jgi:flagellar export protein FliJ